MYAYIYEYMCTRIYKAVSESLIKKQLCITDVRVHVYKFIVDS